MSNDAPHVGSLLGNDMFVDLIAIKANAVVVSGAEHNVLGSTPPPATFWDSDMAPAELDLLHACRSMLERKYAAWYEAHKQTPQAAHEATKRAFAAAEQLDRITLQLNVAKDDAEKLAAHLDEMQATKESLAAEIEVHNNVIDALKVVRAEAEAAVDAAQEESDA